MHRSHMVVDEKTMQSCSIHGFPWFYSLLRIVKCLGYNWVLGHGMPLFSKE